MTGTNSRTSLGLRDTLFDTLEALGEKSISPQEAQAICKVAAQIINSVNTEIEFFKHVSNSKASSGSDPDLTLRLGTQKATS